MIKSLGIMGRKKEKIKSPEKIKNLVNEGVTVILVSHDLSMIEKYCNKVIWMEKGKIKKQEKMRKVVEGYKRWNLKFMTLQQKILQNKNGGKPKSLNICIY